MNTITWYNYDNTDADAFNIYRSVPGFLFSFSDLSQNPTFRFAATSPDVQEIVVDTTSIDTAVASLNTGRGITAAKNSPGTKIIVRLTAQKNARLKLFKCTLLDDIGLQPQIIVPELNFTFMVGVVYTPGSDSYNFIDEDGSYLDAYYMTSVKDSVESLPTFIRKPLLPGIDYCVCEARFIDIQGRPVQGILVTAEPAVLDNSGLSTNKVTVCSDVYGRIALPLLQCQQYVLHAPAIGYNQFIDVPQAAYLDITKAPATTQPEFSPFGDVP